MKAESLSISKVFSSGGDIHYILPHFQREYTWGPSNWQTLLNDVFAVYKTYKPDQPGAEHFMGALVVIDAGRRGAYTLAFKLVDGQQRLTTISLLLIAIARLVMENNPKLYRNIMRFLLNNDDEKNDFRFKLLPTTKYGDRDAYQTIIDGGDVNSLATQMESRIPHAMNYLQNQLSLQINSESEPIDPERLFEVICNCLHVVRIDLDQRERPYEIFESLNAKGVPLKPADLVRNYLAIKLPENIQEKAYEEPWSGIEQRLQEKLVVGRSGMGEITAFLRHYLAMHSTVLANEEHVYARFRDHTKEMNTDEFMRELNSLGEYAVYYDCLLRPEKEPNVAVRTQLQRLVVLENSTAYPFLLRLYRAVKIGEINSIQFMEALKLLENYFVRRYLAGEQSNYMGKMFPSLWNALDTSNFVPSLRYTLAARNYPNDTKLRLAISAREYYSDQSNIKRKLILILDSINRHLSTGTGGYTMLDGDATIEHIMPQTLSKLWISELGAEAKTVHDEYLNTLGNLTLVTSQWNQNLSNNVFSDKRERLMEHALRINSSYFHGVTIWSKEAIEKRGRWLADQIIAVWPLIHETTDLRSDTPQTPIAISIMGQRFLVKSWRDLLEVAVTKLCDLESPLKIRDADKYLLSSEQRTIDSKQLSNGWWLNLTDARRKVEKTLPKVLEIIEFPEEAWEIEFSDSDS
jgi:uncharacterized protein with ParB-like and HNH nuclease domain